MVVYLNYVYQSTIIQDASKPHLIITTTCITPCLKCTKHSIVLCFKPKVTLYYAKFELINIVGIISFCVIRILNHLNGYRLTHSLSKIEKSKYHMKCDIHKNQILMV